MSTTKVPLPADFDALRQNITLYTTDGIQVIANIPMLNQFSTENMEICVVFGSQLGASLIMFLVVMLTTRVSKRRSPIFVMNSLSLMLSLIRSLLQILYYIGPWTEIYRFLAGDYSTVPKSAYANSIGAVVLTLLLLITIETSLVLQTNVVCKTTSNRIRLPVTTLSIVVSLLAVSFRFVLSIRNIQGILGADVKGNAWMLSEVSLVTETASIWFFCTIFVIKLGWTLYQRKKLQLKQWGPMQIITIMGGCTMIIPSLFAIMDYFPTQTFYESGTLAICLVAILLPLSSVWAAAAIDSDEPVRGYWNSPKFPSYGLGSDYKSSSAQLAHSSRKGSAAVEHVSRTSEDDMRLDEITRAGRELGLSLGNDPVNTGGVRVKRSYEVHSGGKGKVAVWDDNV